MITIAPQATLTISPGTVIRFGMNAGILVLGRIVAKGTAQNPVIFSSLYIESHPFDWYGIVLTGTGKKNIFEEVRIDGAETAIYARASTIEAKKIRMERASTAIRLVDSIGLFKDTAISGCSTGFSAVKSEVDLDAVTIEKGKIGLSVLSSALTAEKLRILSFSQSALVADKSQLKLVDILLSTNHTGARVSGCEGAIINSRFLSNLEAGVLLSGSCLKFRANLVSGNRIGLQLEDNLPVIWGNSIQGNSNYNLLYLGDEKLYIGGNWLGKVSTELMNKSLFSRRPEAIMTFPVLAADPLSATETDH